MPPLVPLADVEWRIDSKPRAARTGSGHVARYVPYLSAPVVAALFDQWVGPFGWEDRYEVGELNGRTVLWCYITCQLGDSPPVTKCDLGVPPSGDDAELSDKGLVSDAFKRAATLKWGVGRNVYRLPTLWAACEVNERQQAWPARGVEEELLDQLHRAGWQDDGTRR